MSILVLWLFHPLDQAPLIVETVFCNTSYSFLENIGEGFSVDSLNFSFKYMCKDNQHEYKCGNAPIKISTRARHCVTEKTKALCLTGNFLSLPHFIIDKLSFYGELQSINTSYKYNK